MGQKGADNLDGALSAALSGVAKLLNEGDESAGDRALDILKRNPGQPEIPRLLAGARRAAGDMDGARAIVEDLARTHAGIASVQYERGALLSALGERDGAIDAFSRAAALAPGYPGVWRGLGDELAKAGRIFAATDAYTKHFAQSVRGPATLERTGAGASGVGPGAAGATINRGAHSRPNDPRSSPPGEIARLLRLDARAAAANARDYLERCPGERHAPMLLVCTHRLAGDLRGARNALKAAAKAQPGATAVQYELGLLSNETGERADAIALLSRAVALELRHAQAWRALADVFVECRNAVEANKSYARVIELAAAGLERLENEACGDETRLPRAEEMLRARLSADPTDVVALLLLGSVCIRLERYEEAEKQLLRALDLAPECRSARWMLAGTYYKRQDWKRTFAEAEKLTSADPDNAEYLALRAYSLMSLDEYEKAIAAYETLLSNCPVAEYWRQYGDALTAVGRGRDAIAAYRKALEANPDFAQAYWSLATLKTFRFAPTDVASMKGILERPNLDTQARAKLHFALGKAFEDEGDYAASFDRYREGNAIVRRGISHRAREFSDFVRRSKALFTPNFIAGRAGMGCQAPDPIFIVGLHRSGSTLVEQILASHSMVEGTRELAALSAIAKRIANYERGGETHYPNALEGLSSAQLKSAGESYRAEARLHRKLGRPFFVDKMPGNFQHLPLLYAILPNAKIVDARRHPMGSGFAIFKHYFQQKLSFAFDLDDIGRYYRDYVEMMAHFDAVLPSRVHRVLYEEMVGDPETQVRRLLEYCGLPFEENCLRFYETKRAVHTPSSEQVRQPIFTEALDRWRNYETWLGPLKAALGDVLECYPGTPSFDAPAPASAYSIGKGVSGRFSVRYAPPS